jgi:hypothetical protein
MSKPITLSKPASLAVSAMPTTPPAGPDRIASRPWNRSADFKPPEEAMNMILVASSPLRPGPLSPLAGRGLG